jgi:hypothetical protein
VQKARFFCDGYRRDEWQLRTLWLFDAQLLWIDKDGTSGEIKVSVKKDRAEIESVYHDLFKDAKEKTTSKNTVEFARLVTPELMVIHGVFQPNLDKPDKFSFVQTRVKVGDKWLIKILDLYVFGE